MLRQHRRPITKRVFINEIRKDLLVVSTEKHCPGCQTIGPLTEAIIAQTRNRIQTVLQQPLEILHQSRLLINHRSESVLLLRKRQAMQLQKDHFELSEIFGSMLNVVRCTGDDVFLIAQCVAARAMLIQTPLRLPWYRGNAGVSSAAFDDGVLSDPMV